jgi:hypothetical protein
MKKGAYRFGKSPFTNGDEEIAVNDKRFRFLSRTTNPQYSILTT